MVQKIYGGLHMMQRQRPHLFLSWTHTKAPAVHRQYVGFVDPLIGGPFLGDDEDVDDEEDPRPRDPVPPSRRKIGWRDLPMTLGRATINRLPLPRTRHWRRIRIPMIPKPKPARPGRPTKPWRSTFHVADQAHNTIRFTSVSNRGQSWL